jgi:hypothetical protein
MRGGGLMWAAHSTELLWPGRGSESLEGASWAEYRPAPASARSLAVYHSVSARRSS